jgi:hypothetical protein
VQIGTWHANDIARGESAVLRLELAIRADAPHNSEIIVGARVIRSSPPIPAQQPQSIVVTIAD